MCCFAVRVVKGCLLWCALCAVLKALCVSVSPPLLLDAAALEASLSARRLGASWRTSWDLQQAWALLVCLAVA